MQQALGMPDSVDVKDECSLKNYFSNKFISRYLEKSFVMFFWYLLTGPLGVLFNYVSYQLRDSHGEIQAELSVNLISWVINVLEWVPIRLLGLTFSLAVNFVSCFDRLQASFWRFGLDSDSGEILLGFATGALTGSDQHFEEEDNTATLREQVTVEIEALQGLLERSQMIWLIILALITIFSLQN
jgi:AmpE protein